MQRQIEFGVLSSAVSYQTCWLADTCNLPLLVHMQQHLAEMLEQTWYAVNVVHDMLQTCSTYLNRRSDSMFTDPIAANPQADTARGSQTNQPGLSTKRRVCAYTAFPVFVCEIRQLDCRVGHVNRLLSV